MQPIVVCISVINHTCRMTDIKYQICRFFILNCTIKIYISSFWVTSFHCQQHTCFTSFMTKVPNIYKPSTDLLCKSMNWFLYDRDLRQERVNPSHPNVFLYTVWISQKTSGQKWVNMFCSTLYCFSPTIDLILFLKFFYKNIEAIIYINHPWFALQII